MESIIPHSLDYQEPVGLFCTVTETGNEMSRQPGTRFVQGNLGDNIVGYGGQTGEAKSSLSHKANLFKNLNTQDEVATVGDFQQ